MASPNHSVDWDLSRTREKRPPSKKRRRCRWPGATQSFLRQMALTGVVAKVSQRGQACRQRCRQCCIYLLPAWHGPAAVALPSPPILVAVAHLVAALIRLHAFADGAPGHHLADAAASGIGGSNTPVPAMVGIGREVDDARQQLAGLRLWQ